MEIDQNDFKQLLGLLQKLVEQSSSTKAVSETVEQPEESTEISDEDNFTVKKSKKQNVASKPKEKRPNKFLDMRESAMHKEDIEIDRKLSKFPPTQRTRQYQDVEVTCRVCGRKEKVHPALLESKTRYKCNKCSTSPG